MPPALPGEQGPASSGANPLANRRPPASLAQVSLVELLEPRRLLAATLSASLSRGHLLIEGTEAPDAVVVRSARKRVSVPGLRIKTPSGKVRQVKARAVSLLEVRTLGGDDTVSVDESRHPLRPALWVQGGDGNDTLGGSSRDDALDGGEGDDAIDGGAGNDTLSGAGGADAIDGNAGDDSVSGGAGDDTIRGGDGNDTIDAAEDNDVVYGGAGDDTLDGNLGNDWIGGDDGNDTLRGGGNDDTVHAGAGGDMVHGDSGNDTLDGNAGDDWISGGEGNDAAHGSDGNDTIYAAEGDDTISGGVGDDVLDGNAGNDSVNGSEGHDTIRGGDGDDLVQGAEGDDLVFGGSGSDDLDGGAGDDALVDAGNPSPVRGGPGRDRLYTSDAGRQRLFDREPHDAEFTLVDGHGSGAGTHNAGEARKWSDDEIRGVDAGLRWLHGVAAPLMRLPDGKPLTLERSADGAPAGQPGSKGIAALNDRAGRIIFYDSAFSSAQELAATVVHEVGHNWAEQAYWDQFLILSGWHHDSTPDVGETASTNRGGLSADDWVFAYESPFAREYGREDPHEDWATIWEAVYRHDIGILSPAEQQRLRGKLELVRHFLSSLT